MSTSPEESLETHTINHPGRRQREKLIALQFFFAPRSLKQTSVTDIPNDDAVAFDLDDNKDELSHNKVRVQPNSGTRAAPRKRREAIAIVPADQPVYGSGREYTRRA